jgi:hypothetical protein
MGSTMLRTHFRDETARRLGTDNGRLNFSRLPNFWQVATGQDRQGCHSIM